MELSDFWGFAYLAMLLTLPIWSVYFVLRQMGWGKRNRLLLDAWQVWIAWLISGMASFVLLAFLDHHIHFAVFPKFALIYFPLLLVGNLLTVAGVLRWQIRDLEDTSISITDGDAFVVKSGLPIMWASLFTSMAATASLILVFSFATLVNKAYKKIYPAPENKFQIYDI